MRYSTLSERSEFYEVEFNLREVAKWLQHRKNGVRFAAIIGRHTGIFPEKFRDDAAVTIVIDEYGNLGDVKNQIVQLVPEGVYYDRNIYDASGEVLGQELAFDLDPENVTCPIHGSLADKMRRGQGLGFCKIELDMVKNQAFKLVEYLRSDFSDLRIVYSGRGFHLHVLDEEASRLSRRARARLAARVKERGFQIDEWITVGTSRLIRLPFSLHGMVSRTVLPLSESELGGFDPVKDERCIPRFMRRSV